MYRLTFSGDEDLLDVVLPLLPGGVHELGDTLVAYSGAPFAAAVLEATGGEVDEVPADWRARRHGGVVIGPVGIRSPFDPPSDAEIDVVVERRGSAFGSGSHPTTQMCVALLLQLEPGGAVADLGCGVGTLAIVAAKLGYGPVAGVDRVPVAIEVAAENAARNAVVAEFAVADLAVDPVPLAPLLLVNAPPPVHERVAAALDSTVQHVIVSGIVSHEVQAVIDGYAGFEVAHGLGTEDEWIALRLKRS
jgi:ribosomal protein L11 methyltransferase